MKKVASIVIAVLCLLTSLSAGLIRGDVAAQDPKPMPGRAALLSQFTATPIQIDGVAEKEWEKAIPSRIGMAMNSTLKATAPECTTYGTVRSMWDGALLYLLIEVADPDVTTASSAAISKDGVEIYFDLWNDKFPKNEEDDGIMRISAAGELSGTGVYADRLKSYAAASRLDSAGARTGYAVELAIQIGGVAMKNGSSMGIEFGINDAASPANTRKYRIYWSSGNNKGIDNNTMWGDVVLSGYDGKTPMALDTYMLSSNIKKADALPRGIWMSETELNKALAAARDTLTAKTQSRIDAGNASLDRVIKALRRRGKYPDPFDLPEVQYLPDPFSYFKGGRVKSAADWARRREEIKDLAQYYEYGYMPPAPEAVAATATGSPNNAAVVITIQDKGLTSSFNARLTVPTVEQCGKEGPYPVIVSIDFFAGPGIATYVNAGYAVISFTYSAVASDNTNHTGAFYTLYPYDVTKGTDAGVLLGWAWGAGRCADAVEYLAKKDPAFAKLLDPGKLVVTGFSRCGKAALVAGFLDERFGVVNPGGSGSGGAAPYRYDSFGNTPFRTAPFGNVYPWGVSPGAEAMGDHVRHQTHNSNEMLVRFLNPVRMYKTRTHGYGERLPYDHHEIIAAIAPRAMIIDTSTDDYSNNAEGDSIGFVGAKPVYEFLGAGQKLAFDIRTTGGGHSLSAAHRQNLVSFANMVFYGTPLPEQLQKDLYDNPYIDTYDKYYGGLKTMMPWTSKIPKPNDRPRTHVF
jgi:endo-1,4-beta-xylanase